MFLKLRFTTRIYRYLLPKFISSTILPVAYLILNFASSTKLEYKTAISSPYYKKTFRLVLEFTMIEIIHLSVMVLSTRVILIFKLMQAKFIFFGDAVHLLTERKSKDIYAKTPCWRSSYDTINMVLPLFSTTCHIAFFSLSHY